MNMSQVAVPTVAVVSRGSSARDESGRPGFLARNMQLDVKDHAATGLRFFVVVKDFGSVKVARVGGTRSSFVRTRSHLADGRDLISVVISNGGRFMVDGAQGNNSFGVLGAAILESRRESALHKLDDKRGVWSICMERAPLERLLAGISAPVQRCLQCDNFSLRLLDGYLGVLFGLHQDHDPSLTALHVRDLVLSALGVRGDVQALVRERGVHAARQSTVLETIRLRTGEPKLNPTDVANQLGISVRYVHQLLEPTGRTFSQHVLEQRLENARAQLRNPDCQFKIAQIAFASGFSDISHFNRSFRRAFGDTPFGVRARARRARTRQ